MKPYLLTRQWIDLDQVQMVDEHPIFYPGYTPIGKIRLAFQADPVDIRLGEGELSNEAVYEMWSRFKTAWKTKDTMFGGSK